MMDKGKICKLRDISRAIAAFEADIQKAFSLNMNEAMLLCTLREHDNLTSGEIAQAMGLTTSHASKTITSLEKQGLIRRSVDKTDKRQMHFFLTKKGELKLDELHGHEWNLPEGLLFLCAGE